MSIRIAMVLFGVCAGICVHASSVFSPGDVFPYEVSGSDQLPEPVRTGVFCAGAQAAHSPDLAVDQLLSWLRGSDALPGTSYTPPAEIPTVESALFLTKQGARLKVTASAPALEGDGARAAFYYGSVQPLDLALFSGHLHSPALPKPPAPEAAARLLRIDLTSDTRGGHAWGRRFWGLTVANGKLLGCIYKDFSPSVWDTTNNGEGANLPADSESDSALDKPPVAATEPSLLVLIATGLLMLSVRAICRR